METRSDRSATFEWRVEGMDCGSCVSKVRSAVEKLPGVTEVKASSVSETLTAEVDEALTSASEIERRVSSLGYKVVPKAPIFDGANPVSDAPAVHTWTVGGMDCASCAAKIERAVERLSGVSEVRVSTATETLTARLNSKTAPRELESRVASLGYSIAPKHVVASKTAGASQPSLADERHDHNSHNHEPDTETQRARLKQAGGRSAQGRNEHESRAGAWWATHKGRVVLLTGVLLAAGFLTDLLRPDVSSWVYVVATLLGVLPVAKRAFAALRAGLPFTIEMLMTIAAAGALIIGAAEEAALVVFLFAVGEVLESVAANRARASIRALSDLIPKTALLEINGAPEEVPASSVTVGQIVLVRPGDRVPADGAIVTGTSGIDESPVTGESIPLTKTAGDPVFAGSINREAVIRVRVEKAAEDNTIARIIKLVEEAQDARAPTERFIDRFSRWYMPAIVGLAIAVAVLPPMLADADWSTWIYRALALLLIGCPCALVISVPASIASALSAGARQGLLIKGGAVIEETARARLIAFDKTGTLTQGRPVVTDVLTYRGTESDAAELVASVETGSSHPLAAALVHHAESINAPIRPAIGMKAMPGKGVVGNLDGREIFVGAPRFARDYAGASLDVSQADIERLEREGKTVTTLVVDGRLHAIFALRDEPRLDARVAIFELEQLGIRSLMLTGDNSRTGAAIARELGIDHRAELMPEQKVQAIREVAGTAPLMMVGDGINDAPALAAARVGVAMGSGTDVALETADAALLRSRVLDVVHLIRLARATMGNIRQNIAIALGLKAVFLVTSVLGITGLWIAILADTGATVIVTANALRLLAFFADQSGGSAPGGENSREPDLQASPA